MNTHIAEHHITEHPYCRTPTFLEHLLMAASKISDIFT